MAANQSRRRVTESADKPESLEQVEEFQYQELRADVDSLRLLTIEPTDNADDTIVCRLEVVEFGAKPEYEALSYMWGSEENQSPIMMNGCSFPVRQNLLEALRYRRSKFNKLPIWIDALCINQRDVTERNRQLRIMHHIYFRACRVVIWLGVHYNEYRDLVPRLRTSLAGTEGIAPTDGVYSITKDEEQTIVHTRESRFVDALSKDGYWQRLWIIQEVGQAKKLVICFGSFHPMQWDDFTHLMRMHNIGDDGPLRLDRLKCNADVGALTFRRLLYDHQMAVCTEQRDKVYGLVGLAADAHGFPMDYTKPLIQVWKDVMHFVNKQRLVDDAELMQFGAMVKFLIIGDECTPLMQVLRSESFDSHEPETADLAVHPSFKMDGVVIGQIVHIGATTTAIINQLSTVDAWNQKVQENFRDHVEEAQKESRMLQRAILEPSTAHECYNHVSSVRWLAPANVSAVRSSGIKVNHALDYYCERLKHCLNASMQSNAASPEPSLYQLHTQTYARETMLWRMGIVSCQAKAGDLVVRLRDMRRAMIVRLDRDQNRCGYVCLQIVGTAWVTADVGTQIEEHPGRLDCFPESDTIPIEMDANTMFVMLS